MSDRTKRQNYDSGEAYVLEYGELRFTYNDDDFRGRIEIAAKQLGFISGKLLETEVDDLTELVVHAGVDEPASHLGSHIRENWHDLMNCDEVSLVHWLRRITFRSSWLDQRVIEGELDFAFDEDTGTFDYTQPDRGDEPIVLATGPDWSFAQYTGHSQ